MTETDDSVRVRGQLGLLTCVLGVLYGGRIRGRSGGRVNYGLRPETVGATRSTEHLGPGRLETVVPEHV